jgi:outer membrane protein
VVRDQLLVEVNRNNQHVRKELEATTERFRIGELTGTDVARAQAASDQATTRRVAAEGQLEVSRAHYTRAVGHPPGRLTFPRERPALPATREDALRLAADANPNVISAVFTELAARDNIDVVRGQLLPQISVVGNLNRSASAANTIAGSIENSASIMINGTMALYEGGAIYPLRHGAPLQGGEGQNGSALPAASRSEEASCCLPGKDIIGFAHHDSRRKR